MGSFLTILEKKNLTQEKSSSYCPLFPISLNEPLTTADADDISM